MRRILAVAAVLALAALAAPAPVGAADDAGGDVKELAPLIGDWTCTTRAPQPDGSVKEGSATWSWWWILNGEAIMDEWRSTRENGDEFVGINIRHVDPESGKWVVRWLPSGLLKWSEFEGEHRGGRFVMRGPYQTPSGVEGFGRVTFSDIEESHFSWSLDFSNDGVEWAAGVFLIECTK